MLAPICQLFLVTPSTGSVRSTGEAFGAVAGEAAVASLVVRQQADRDQTRALAKLVIAAAHANDVAVMIEDDAELGAQLGADGVQLSSSGPSYQAARATVGTHGIVGVQCGAERHLAMEMAESGADYVVIDQGACLATGEPVISWWAELFEVPCVAGQPAGKDELRDVARLRADFARPDDRMWQSSEHAVKIISASTDALREAWT